MNNHSGMNITVAAFSGSLRKESYTTKLVKLFRRFAPKNVTVEIIDISHLPLMNEDLETDLPQSVKICTAVSNAPMPYCGPLPNTTALIHQFLKMRWTGVRGRRGKINGMESRLLSSAALLMLWEHSARHHLRQVLVYLNMPALQQPEFYLTKVSDKFNEQNDLKDEKTREKIIELWAAFIQWINKVR